MKRPSPSLQARALGWLAQREQSRSELRRKLLRVALLPPPAAADDEPATRAAPRTWRHRWTSCSTSCRPRACSATNVSSKAACACARPAWAPGASRWSCARHGLKLPAQPLQQLRDSELQRATQLWQRKFGAHGAGRARARAADALPGRTRLFRRGHPSCAGDRRRSRKTTTRRTVEPIAAHWLRAKVRPPISRAAARGGASNARPGRHDAIARRCRFRMLQGG